MKKKNLSLSQIKVKSFITNLDTAQATTAKGGGGEYEFTKGDPLCTRDCKPVLIITATTCIRRK